MTPPAPTPGTWAEHPLVSAGTLPDAGTDPSLTLSGPGLAQADLEAVYDALADAIDAAGPAGSEGLLVRLALLAAQSLGDRARFERLLRAAQAGG